MYQAVIVTLVATLARNLTDDFLVYAMATTFCVVIGALLGEASRLAAGSAGVAVPPDAIGSGGQREA